MQPTTGKDEYTPVNHPLHYNVHPNGIECIDVVEGFNFNIGNAIKYLWRAGLKSDDAVKDLEKAAWYVQRELERCVPELHKNIVYGQTPIEEWPAVATSGLSSVQVSFKDCGNPCDHDRHEHDGDWCAGHQKDRT